jgi:AcrR family transcriptional regulator
MGNESEEETEVVGTRHRILQIALTLMSQRGVDGTSMRDLAAAAELNVASLYHYFPSKRDLLEAVLMEHGYLPVRAREPVPEDDPSAEAKLAALLGNILNAMLEVEDFVRLMVGEAMRGEVTARAIGLDLFGTFHISMEAWMVKHRPDLDPETAAPAMARLLTAIAVGTFVEHAAGVMTDIDGNLSETFDRRAREAAALLSQLVGEPVSRAAAP